MIPELEVPLAAAEDEIAGRTSGLNPHAPIEGAPDTPLGNVDASPARRSGHLAPPVNPPAQVLLAELLRHLGVSAEVMVRRSGEDLVLHAKLGKEADGSGLGGERPPLLEPIVYLLGKMINRGQPDGGARSVVRLSFGDTPPPLPDGPPGARAASGATPGGAVASVSSSDEIDPEVVETGRWLANRAKALGKTLTVGPMTARERRSIHLAGKEAGGVTTRSEGEGLLRRVLVVPDPPVASASPTDDGSDGSVAR